MCKEAASRGYRPVVMVYRGCGGVELLTDQIYSASFTDDVHLAVETVNRQYPDAKLTAVGFSLGSLLLTKYLGEADTGHWEPGGLLSPEHPASPSSHLC